MAEFNFPDNAAIQNGSIRNFASGNQFRDIDITRPVNNLIEIEGTSYYYTYLGESAGNKGGNSIILKLYESQFIDSDAAEYGEPDLILKISKIVRAKHLYSAHRRFEKEVEALNSCNRENFQNVIRIFHSGICRIKNPRGSFEDHDFYTMEYADADLKTYVESNHSALGVEEKIQLCLSLSEGLKELYSLGYYHRDIKPDNIFMISDEWKIGDLGLLSERSDPNEIDRVADFIGPKGWMSPESMNKYLCEGKGFPYVHNCSIDHQSDIFQLGKVFWYIFQYNAPIGSVKERDFQFNNSRIYAILKTMLSHSKKRRYGNIEEVIFLLKKCEENELRRLVA